MIFYNGATGGLGRYFSAAATAEHELVTSLMTRLEDDLLPVRSSASQMRTAFVHMAAKVSVTECERDADAAFRTNVIGALAHVRSFVGWCGAEVPTVVYVSSGHVYAESDAPISETHPVAPRSVYAETKLEAERAMKDLARRWSFPLVIARIFGLVAPQQRDCYLLPSLIRRVVERDSSPVPGLDCVRDYLDSRDVCRILVKLSRLRPQEPEIFNVCSGQMTSVRQILSCVIDEMIRHKREVNYWLPEAAPGRPSDLPVLVGDETKLQNALKCTIKTISLNKTVNDALRERL